MELPLLAIHTAKANMPLKRGRASSMPHAPLPPASPLCPNGREIYGPMLSRVERNSAKL